MKLGEMVFLFVLVMMFIGGALILGGYISMSSVKHYWFWYAPITLGILAVGVPFLLIGLIYWAYKNVGKGM